MRALLGAETIQRRYVVSGSRRTRLKSMLVGVQTSQDELGQNFTGSWPLAATAVTRSTCTRDKRAFAGLELKSNRLLLSIFATPRA
jgi:hypothetical protein